MIRGSERRYAGKVEIVAREVANQLFKRIYIEFIEFSLPFFGDIFQVCELHIYNESGTCVPPFEFNFVVISVCGLVDGILCQRLAMTSGRARNDNGCGKNAEMRARQGARAFSRGAYYL